MPTKICLDNVHNNTFRRSDAAYMDSALKMGGALTVQATGMVNAQLEEWFKAAGQPVPSFLTTEPEEVPAAGTTLDKLRGAQSDALASWKDTQRAYCELAHAANSFPSNDNIPNLCIWPDPSWQFYPQLFDCKSSKEVKAALAEISKRPAMGDKASGSGQKRKA